jgi:hypothetical protein
VCQKSKKENKKYLSVDSFFASQKISQISPKNGYLIYIYLKLFIKYDCTKNGQIEKEVDFKSLLKIDCEFIHKISTKAVEKGSANFLSANGILQF